MVQKPRATQEFPVLINGTKTRAGHRALRILDFVCHNIPQHHLVRVQFINRTFPSTTSLLQTVVNFVRRTIVLLTLTRWYAVSLLLIALSGEAAVWAGGQEFDPKLETSVARGHPAWKRKHCENDVRPLRFSVPPPSYLPSCLLAVGEATRPL